MIAVSRINLFESGALRLGRLFSLLAAAVEADSSSQFGGDLAFPSEMDDIQKSQQGDSQAYKRLIERHQDHISKVLWRFSRDGRVHEELVQDVFVEAFMSLRTYKAKAPFEHWLTRIATRVGYNFWKLNHKRQEREALRVEDWDRFIDGENDPDSPEEAAELLYKMLARLAPRDRLVLTLRYLEECDVEETANRTGWTKTMVKVQTMRAKNRLREMFGSAGLDAI